VTPPISGTVYLDNKFEFPDGASPLPKYIVVICDSMLDDDSVIVVRTTSREKDKGKVLGCSHSTYPPYHFMSTVIDVFPRETWLMLDYVVEYAKDDICILPQQGMLSTEDTASILNCVTQVITLENYVIKSATSQLDLFRRSGLI